MGKEKKSFINYRASAGSGKTYRLVLEYLALALDDTKGDRFKHILAITFTNKAAAEMKERILRSLKELSKGDNPVLKKNLLETAPSLTGIEEKAGKVLKKALHDYSHFSVMTIDSFINRLVRSFTYETDILKIIDDLAEWGIDVRGVIITRLHLLCFWRAAVSRAAKYTAKPTTSAGTRQRILSTSMTFMPRSFTFSD